MQHNDDSPKPSRPSLLTPAQQAEADRHRILSQLETGKVGKPAARRKRSKLLGIGALALVAALAVTVGLWAHHNDEADGHLAVVSAAAGGDAAAVAPAVPTASAGTASAGTAPANTASANTASAASSEVSAEEVLSSAAPASTAPASTAPASTAPAAVIQEDRTAQAQDKKQSLGEMLEHPGNPASAAPAGKHDPNMLSSALESPSAGAAAPQSPHKAAAKEKPKAKPATVAKAPRPKEQEKASPEEENDVALLAALVAHTQSEERRPEPQKKPRLSLDEQLNQCKKLSKTKAAQCHERVCEGRSNTGGCKVKK